MNTTNEKENIKFCVVVNNEDQYSIWPCDKDLPLGWEKTGAEGTEKICLDYIEKVWTDMRPRSLKNAMKATQ